MTELYNNVITIFSKIILDYRREVYRPWGHPGQDRILDISYKK